MIDAFSLGGEEEHVVKAIDVLVLMRLFFLNASVIQKWVLSENEAGTGEGLLVLIQRLEGQFQALPPYSQATGNLRLLSKWE